MAGTTDARGIYTPAAQEIGWDTAVGANFALFATLTEQTTAINAALAGINSFSKGAAFFDSTAVPVATVAAWTAPFACTVTALKGYRVGGTGATVLAYKGTTATALSSSALSLSSASTWLTAASVQNTAFATGNSLLIAVLTNAGNATQISIQVNFTRP